MSLSLSLLLNMSTSSPTCGIRPQIAQSQFFPLDITIYGEGSVTHDPFSSPHTIPPPSLYAKLIDLSSPYQVIHIPPPTRIQYLLNRVPLDYLVREVVDPKLLKDELEELIAFITRSGRVSKPVTYLHPEGKGKEKMTETETKVQRQTREVEEKK